MTFSEEQVEWIVVEVIRRLGLMSASHRGAAAEEHSSTHDELVLKDRVITLRLLEGRWTGVARLVVPPRAVVTPAVRDELKARKIEMVVRASD
jgi:hypothetical protein